jgi:hypothetical protein
MSIFMLRFHVHFPSKGIGAEGKKSRSENREEIYIETENGYFPGIGWSDLPLSVVSMWISNTMRMLDPQYGEHFVTNYFMDGPYCFDLQKTEKESIVIRFMRCVGESKKEKIPSLTIAFTDYCHALLDLAENIISDSDFQWYGKEQERIHFKQSVAKLRAALL